MRLARVLRSPPPFRCALACIPAIAIVHHLTARRAHRVPVADALLVVERSAAAGLTRERIPAVERDHPIAEPSDCGESMRSCISGPSS